MITHFDDGVLTAEQIAKYQELFAALSQKTGRPITKLVHYFDALNSLELSDRNNYKFWRLPIDEEYFVIDNNSRTITIPTNFSKYGLGIQGDHLAEIVYFEVDRFFDTMDLLATATTGTMHIEIQWKNISANQTGVTKAIFVDQTEEKIYFGWPIDDILTQASGNIDFGVRFYMTDTNDTSKIVYSLSTATASCKIISGLDFEVTAMEVEDYQDQLLTRPIYSGVINSMTGAAPIITTNLDDTIEYNLTSTDDNGKTYLTLAVVAESPVVGDTLKYQWYKDNAAILDEDGDGNLDGEAASYNAKIAGYYYVKVGNYNVDNGTRWIDSKVAYIPAASAITITDTGRNTPEKAYIDNTTLTMAVTGQDDEDILKYQWYQNGVKIETATAASYIPTAQATYKCTVINTRNNTESVPVTSNDCVLRNRHSIFTGVTVTKDAAANTLTVALNDAYEAMTERTLKYQWFTVDGGALAGKTTKSITYDPTVDAGKEYRVRVWECVFDGSSIVDQPQVSTNIMASGYDYVESTSTII